MLFIRNLCCNCLCYHVLGSSFFIALILFGIIFIGVSPNQIGIDVLWLHCIVRKRGFSKLSPQFALCLELPIGIKQHVLILDKPFLRLQPLQQFLDGLLLLLVLRLQELVVLHDAEHNMPNLLRFRIQGQPGRGVCHNCFQWSINLPTISGSLKRLWAVGDRKWRGINFLKH